MDNLEEISKKFPYKVSKEEFEKMNPKPLKRTIYFRVYTKEWVAVYGPDKQSEGENYVLKTIFLMPSFLKKRD